MNRNRYHEGSSCNCPKLHQHQYSLKAHKREVNLPRNRRTLHEIVYSRHDCGNCSKPVVTFLLFCDEEVELLIVSQEEHLSSLESATWSVPRSPAKTFLFHPATTDDGLRQITPPKSLPLNESFGENC